MNIVKIGLAWIFGFLTGVVILILIQTTFGQELSFITAKQIELETTKEPTGAYKQELFDGYSEIHVYETPNKQYGYEIIENINGNSVHTGYGPESQERTYIIHKIEPYKNSTSTNEKII